MKYYTIIEKHDDDDFSITTVWLNENTVENGAESSTRGTLQQVIDEVFGE